MKKVIELKDSWEVRGFNTEEVLKIEGKISLANYDVDYCTKWIKTSMPAQIHEILLSKGIIENPSLLGKVKECIWVAEKDWFYKCNFKFNEMGKKTYLYFKGLDTLVDIYLNGKHLAYHNDMYLPLRLEVSQYLKRENVLILYFHSPHRYIKNLKLPEEWEGKIEPHRLIRKNEHDFTDYMGAKPYLTCMGVYDKVLLEVIDDIEIIETDISIKLLDGYRKGKVKIKVNGMGYKDGSILKFKINDPKGQTIAEHICPINCYSNNEWNQVCELTVKNPQLWWPRGYGDQPLYKISVFALNNDQVKDSNIKFIGFREVKMVKPFDFIINNRQVKLWGALVAQMQGITHCWSNDKSNAILDLVENCNMNSLRIWGGSDIYDDKFYDETDKRGILIWQEFFHDYGMYPDNNGYRALCIKEAEYQVKRLKHHPSLLFWCGGNECFMGGEYDFPGEKYIGAEIFLEDYRKVCETLDPDRYYHINSPSGGAYANDPLAGDTHSYTNTWYVPGADYPVMIAEEIRTSPPSSKSLIKYLGEEKAWPANYSGMITSKDKYPWPESWNERTSAEGWKKIPPIELFYDSDTLESIVYKFGAAHGYYLRKILENNRRGKPSTSPRGERICKGHFVCRFNDSWPIIYGSMLDYYLEPYIPYYTVKRAYEPILLSFDIQDFIYVWITNDSPQDVEGTVFIKLFNPAINNFINEIKKSVYIISGESKLITNLNEFGQFPREYILYAYLVDKKGDIIARANDFVDIEKHLRFPEAKVKLELNGDVLKVTTDKFARCIELKGNNQGDEFGWIFEDNFFDLFPEEEKEVKILGKHKKGTITAKSYYSNFINEVAL